MSATSRRKGLRGEREVAMIYGEAGGSVRGLEGSGDQLIFMPKLTGTAIHSEVKRYGSRCKWPEWWAQTEAEAPPASLPVLHTRADHGEWLVTLRLADFVAVIR